MKRTTSLTLRTLMQIIWNPSTGIRRHRRNSVPQAAPLPDLVTTTGIRQCLHHYLLPLPDDGMMDALPFASEPLPHAS